MKILIAEDESGFALILRRILEKQGYDVTVTSDGSEAWEALQREEFPLIISDWMMPVMDGPSLCRRIRARENAPYTYIILLTSRIEPHDRLEGLYSGADDFLEKPLGRGELFARLEIARRILAMQEVLQRQNAQMAETVAALARAVMERERLAERERNITEHLQAALTPPVPDCIPGMALVKYYEAALDEASVGGDFYDVFPLEKGYTALVVGDLMGKGLAAASQVATVRNMLRYALYRSRTMIGALQSLNSILAENHLLTGFATLFVGVYDSGARSLDYVNCGQEPAVLRRAAGQVEFLEPTGPVLGTMEGAIYEMGRVTLEPGDGLIVFTDGLTEVGRSRTEMLGIEGVAALLEESNIPSAADGAIAVAEHLALCLIAEVDKILQDSVMCDDICLLVAVMT